MGALKMEWRKRMGTYKEKEKPPEKPPEDSSSEEDEDGDFDPRVLSSSTSGAAREQKTFKHMEKELRKRLEASSPEQLSKLFFKAMVAQDQDMIRRLLSQDHLDINATNVKGETAMDVAQDRGKTKSLEVIDEWRQRQARKKRGRGGKAPGELSTEHLNLQCSAEIEAEIKTIFKQFDRDGEKLLRPAQTVC
jgi:hypothetical protein